MAPAAGATLATAHRMIDGVHGDAAVVRTTPEPALATGFAQADVLVVEVRDLADGGAAGDVDLANLAARQLHLGVVAVLGHQLRRGARGAHQLAALAFSHLDVVNHRTGRDLPERQRVAGLNVGVAAGD